MHWFFFITIFNYVLCKMRGKHHILPFFLLNSILYKQINVEVQRGAKALVHNGYIGNTQQKVKKKCIKKNPLNRRHREKKNEKEQEKRPNLSSKVFLDHWIKSREIAFGSLRLECQSKDQNSLN